MYIWRNEKKGISKKKSHFLAMRKIMLLPYVNRGPYISDGNLKIVCIAIALHFQH